MSGPSWSRKSGSVVRFGVFALDTDTGDLWKSECQIRLPDQPRLVLRMLVSRAASLGDVYWDWHPASADGGPHRAHGRGLPRSIRTDPHALEQGGWLATVEGDRRERRTTPRKRSVIISWKGEIV